MLKREGGFSADSGLQRSAPPAVHPEWQGPRGVKLSVGAPVSVAAAPAIEYELHNKSSTDGVTRPVGSDQQAPGGQKKPRKGRVRAGAEQMSSPAHRIARSAAHLTAAPCTSQRKHQPTNAAPKKPRVLAAGAILTGKQARTQRNANSPRSLESPGRHGCWPAWRPRVSRGPQRR